jgi:hypothetical protein
MDDFERRLAEADFSAETRIKAPLRARLTARRRRSHAWVLVPAFALAAGLLLVSHRAPEPATTAYPRGAHGLPVLPGTFPAETAARAPRLFARAEGKVYRSAEGSTTLWSVDGETYALETRRISKDQLFETRTRL